MNVMYKKGSTTGIHHIQEAAQPKGDDQDAQEAINVHR